MFEKIETKRLIFKPFSTISQEEKRIIVESWKNPFNARFNAICNPTSTCEEIACRKEPTFSIIEKSTPSFKDTNYFRVVFDKESGELVGVCRFGMYYTYQKKEIWDFALFNVVMKHWGKGYGAEMLQGVCEFAKQKGVKYLYAGASNDNFASYRTMIKNGFKYCGLSEGDFEYRRDLSLPSPTSEEIESEWLLHIRRYIRKFGKKRYSRLMKISSLIQEMICKIKSGEDEKILTEKYFEICNKIEPFPEKCEGE